jgi:UDPglucose 6-dehydrogenase
VKALRHTGQSVGMDLRVLGAVEAINESQKHVLVDKIIARFGPDLTGRRFAIWGLSFKPGTDDMREAPSLVIIKGLIDHGATVCAYDPVAVAEARRSIKGWRDIEFAASGPAATQGADALVIATEWKEFRSPDFSALRSDLKQPVIFDGRNLFDPEFVGSEGIEYHCVGRPGAAIKQPGQVSPIGSSSA